MIGKWSARRGSHGDRSPASFPSSRAPRSLVWNNYFTLCPVISLLPAKRLIAQSAHAGDNFLLMISRRTRVANENGILFMYAAMLGLRVIKHIIYRCWRISFLETIAIGVISWMPLRWKLLKNRARFNCDSIVVFRINCRFLRAASKFKVYQLLRIAAK